MSEDNETLLGLIPQIQTTNSPVKIAFCEKTRSNLEEFQVNVQPLLEILNRPEVSNLPIVIFSMNGITRCGKSFFLNQIVKYFKFHQTNPDDWIDQPLENGFEWIGQWDSVTEGIQLWPEPFFLEDKNDFDRKIVVLLLDNQGLEDDNVTIDSAHKLFCLSSCLSSIFTYCDTKCEAKSFLENLHHYAQFSRGVERDSGFFDNADRGKQTKFGTLILQCKDFRFHQQYPCDGCSFYDKCTTKSTPADNCLYAALFGNTSKVTRDTRNIRRAMTDLYDNILVCALRGPGNSEPDNDQFATSNTWDPQHLLGIKKFIYKVFNYDFLRNHTKRLFGDVLTGEQLAPFVEHWIKSLLNSKCDLTKLTCLELNRNIYFKDKIEKSLLIYQDMLSKYIQNPCGTSIQVFQENALRKIRQELWTDCLHVEWKNEFQKHLDAKIVQHLRSQVPALRLAYKAEGSWKTFVSEVKHFSNAMSRKVSGLNASEAAVVIGAGLASFGVGGIAAWYWYRKRKSEKMKKDKETESMMIEMKVLSKPSIKNKLNTGDESFV